MSKKLALVLAGVLLGLFLLEGGLRLIGPSNSTQAQVGTMSRFATQAAGYTTFTFNEKSKFRHETDEFSYDVSINSHHLRDREIPYEKEAGEFRILMLGPSWVWGWGVPEEQSIPKLVEAGLRKKFPKRKITLINAGQPARWLTSNILFYLSEGEKYHPDAVVLLQLRNLSYQAVYDSYLLSNAAQMPLTVEQYFASWYRNLGHIPVLRSSRLAVLFLDRLRSWEWLRHRIERNLEGSKVNALSMQQLAAITGRAEPVLYPLYESIAAIPLEVRKLGTGFIREELNNTLDPRRQDYSKSRPMESLFADSAQEIAEFFRYLQSKGVKTFYVSAGGHQYLGPGPERDKETRVDKLSIEALQSRRIDFLTWKIPSPAFFYPKDKHLNREGNAALARAVESELLKRHWIGP